MTEGNSCFGGGKPGVRDAFASALWGADYMLPWALAGYRGINVHGGGEGLYTPIAIGENLSTELRPLYFGMQFAQQFAGWTLQNCTVDGEADLTDRIICTIRRYCEEDLFCANVNAGRVSIHYRQHPAAAFAFFVFFLAI